MELQNCMTDMLSTLASGFGDKALMLVDKDGTPAGHILGTEMVGAMEYEHNKHNRIPLGYTELAYIGSNGSAIINTGISGGSDTLTITCDFKWSTASNFAGIYGNYANEPSNTTRLTLSNTDNRLIVSNNSKAGGGSYVFDAARNYRHVVVSSFGKVTVDGNTMTTSEVQGDNNSRLIALFTNSVSTSGTDIGMIIYSFSIKNNDAYVLNLIPAKRNSDNVVGMYDLVSNTFLTNAGTGTFSYGEL